MSYDKKCYELAEEFLTDYEVFCSRKQVTGHLAQVIQDAIEDELSAMMDACEIGEEKESAVTAETDLC